MAKHSRKSRRHSRRHRRQRGGYSSASTYGEYVNGPVNAQYDRVFDQTGQYAARQSNVLVGAQGQWAQQPNTPTTQNLSLVQSAGKSRRRRGGFVGEVINQAIVPFTILGMQQTYRRKRGGKKTRKHH